MCKFYQRIIKLSNELKKRKAMKITEETKIKDLIPEGYELDNETEYSAKNAHDLLERYVILPFKKKESKDFKWYVGEYMNSIFINLKYKVHGNVYDNFRSGNFDKVHFEFKIGLLKFICDDLKLDIQTLILGFTFGGKIMDDITSICPKEFLNSIFK